MGAVSSDLGLKKDRSDETKGTKRIYIEAFVGVTISCLYHHSTIQDHHSTIQDHYSTITSIIESTITRTISKHITSPSPHHHLSKHLYQQCQVRTMAYQSHNQADQ